VVRQVAEATEYTADTRERRDDAGALADFRMTAAPPRCPSRGPDEPPVEPGVTILPMLADWSMADVAAAGFIELVTRH